MEITKEKFKDYRRCQSIGAYNMLCYGDYCSSGLTKLTKDEWFEIVWHYNEYYEKYKN